MLCGNKKKLCYTKKDIHVDLKYLVLHRKGKKQITQKAMLCDNKKSYILCCTGKKYMQKKTAILF